MVENACIINIDMFSKALGGFAAVFLVAPRSRVEHTRMSVYNDAGVDLNYCDITVLWYYSYGVSYGIKFAFFLQPGLP